jgi:error-prone DNA polymerase
VAADVPQAGHRRRAALWRLGAAAPGIRMRVRGSGPGRTVDAGTQLALPLPLPEAPGLPALGAWDAMIADYRTTGVTTTTHPVALLRPELDAQGAVGTAGFAGLRHGQAVRVGGLVVARQRPGTAKGIVFMLLEDEAGTINLIVSPAIYDRDRLAVRTEPLVVADGVFERHPAGNGQVNVVVKRIWALEAPGRPLAAIKDFSPLDLAELERATGGDDRDRGSRRRAGDFERLAPTGTDGGDFRAVAPPAMSFAQGRRR